MQTLFTQKKWMPMFFQFEKEPVNTSNVDSEPRWAPAELSGTGHSIFTFQVPASSSVKGRDRVGWPFWLLTGLTFCDPEAPFNTVLYIITQSEDSSIPQLFGSYPKRPTLPLPTWWGSTTSCRSLSKSAERCTQADPRGTEALRLLSHPTLCPFCQTKLTKICSA